MTETGAKRPNDKSSNVSKSRRHGRKEKPPAYAKPAPTQLSPARPAATPAAISTINAGTGAQTGSSEPPSSRPKNVSKPDGGTNGQEPRILSEKRQLNSGHRNGGRNA